MGINLQSLMLLLQADKEEPIQGKFLTFGYNTVTVRPEDLIRLATIYGKNINSNWISNKRNIDTHTKHSSMLGYVLVDQNRLIERLFPGVKRIDVMDKSSYEKANIIYDLNTVDLPKNLISTYDYIYDGSVLDNIFSPSNGLINILNLLQNGGRVSGLNSATFVPGVMCALSNEFFYSFFMSNNFSGTLIYSTCRLKENSSDYAASCDWFLYQPTYKPTFGYHAGKSSVKTREKYSQVHSHYYAKKNMIDLVTEENACGYSSLPVNLQYIDGTCVQWQLPSRNSMHGCTLGRLPLSNSHIDLSLYESTHYIYMGCDAVNS